MPLIKTSKVQINASTYVAVNVPSDAKELQGFFASTDDNTDFYISETGSDDDRVMWIGGSTFGYFFDKKLKFGSGTVTLFYVKGVTTTYLGLGIV